MNNILADLTFYVVTFGCQMNKHDSERVVGMLESKKCLKVESVENADIVVYMTCCVREAAEVRLRGQVSSMKNIPLRKQTHMKKRYVAIGGCIGQKDREGLLKALPNVDVVFGTNNIEELPQLLEQSIHNNERLSQTKEATEFFPTSLPTHRESPFSAWLPIMIGCNNFCTYCIVPYVRGREKSRPLDEIILEAQQYVDQGVKEITLLGQNVNSYGHDLGDQVTFSDVLRGISNTGVERIMFATSHPKDLSDDVIKCFKELPNVMPYLHLPVQSGSNRILELMNRKYSREHYLDLISMLRKDIPNIALSTDIIVGFPGETEEDFMQTYDLVKQVGYSQVFTFIYSKRSGTPAAEMDQNASKEEIQDRFDRLVSLVQEKAYEANQAETGTIAPVLIEGFSKRDKKLLTGRTHKNQTVHFACPDNLDPETLIGQIKQVRVTLSKTWYLLGELI